MAEPTTRTKLTYEDFLQLPDDGKRHEIIDGLHYVTASPVLAHQRILGKLYLAIARFIEGRDLGEAFLSPLDVVFSDFDIVEPDLLYVSRERRSILTEANVQGSPDLVVEILSPSTKARDRGIKKKLYERREVGEYWIVDPEAEAIEVFRREPAGGLQLAAELRRQQGDRLATPLLAGLDVPLDEIFTG